MTAHLVGRDTELDALRHVLDMAARHENGSVVAVEGVPGIGKSRLLYAAAQLAREQSFVVASARAGVLDHNVPFGVVRQLFEPPLRYMGPEDLGALQDGPTGLAIQMLLSVFPPSARGAGEDAGATTNGESAGYSHAVVHSLFWLMNRLAGESALLVTLDDLQWADAPSLRFLTYLVRRIADLPMVLVVARTAGEPAAHPDLMPGLLDGYDTLTSLTLRGLSGDQAHELVWGCLGRPVDEKFSAACHDATSGNPFLLLALLRHLDEMRLEPTADSVPRIEQFPPEALVQRVALQLCRVSPDATALVRALTVLGDGADPATTAALAGLDVPAAADAVAVLRRLHILADKADKADKDANPRGDADSLRFMHSIVRNAVAAPLTSLQRSREHARAAQLLHNRGAPAAQIAAQLLHSERAGLPAPARAAREEPDVNSPEGSVAYTRRVGSATMGAGEPWVLAALLDAAEDAVTLGAPEVAVRLLRRALDEPLTDEAHTELLVALGKIATRVDMHAAIGYLTEALEHLTDLRQRCAVTASIASCLYSHGRSGEAVALIDRILAQVMPVDPGLAFGLEMVKLGVATCVPDQYPVIEPLYRHMDERFPSVEGTHRFLASLLAFWHCTAMSAPTDRIVALATHALRSTSVEKSSDPFQWWTAVVALIFADELELSERFCSEVIRSADRRGAAVMHAVACALRGFAVYRRGDIPQAREDIEKALSLWDDLAQHPFDVVVFGFVPLLEAMMDQGEHDQATALLGRYGLWGELPYQPASTFLLVARARLRIETGQPSAGLADLSECRRIAPPLRYLNPAMVARRSWAALAHHTLGDGDEARRLAAEELELARAWGRPRALGTALRTLGLVTGGAAGLALLGEAVSVLDGTLLRLDLVRALAAHGSALRQAGYVTEARDRLRRAHELAEQCSATVLSGSVLGALVQAGARPRKATLASPGRLTRSERSVAELAASGLTNRSIAARLGVVQRTVELHLSAVYRKLSVTSRTDLARTVAEWHHDVAKPAIPTR